VLFQQAANEAGQQLQLRDIHASLLGRQSRYTLCGPPVGNTNGVALSTAVRLRRTPKGACGRRRQPLVKIAQAPAQMPPPEAQAALKSG
jgi:hypothetical protein